METNKRVSMFIPDHAVVRFRITNLLIDELGLTNVQSIIYPPVSALYAICSQSELKSPVDSLLDVNLSLGHLKTGNLACIHR